jgi:hypothetical protein
VDNNPVETGTGGYTLGGLQIKNGFTQYLKMKGPLVLTGDSQMTSNADIWSDRLTARLTQQAGTFTWSSGRINSRGGSVKSDFNVGGLLGGTLLVNNTATVILGSDLRPAAGGTVLLQNTGTLKLANQATIINNGSIQISVDNNLGIDKNMATDATVTITNGFGTIWKSGGTATYQINEPVLNQNGTIKVDDGVGTLSFDGKTAATSNTSLYQTGGGIQLAGTSTINAGLGYQMDSGEVVCVGEGFNCTLSGGGNFTMNGGTVEVGNTDDPGSYGTLTLDVATKVNWNGGTFNFTYDTVSSTASKGALTGNVSGGMTIGATGPSLTLDVLGGGANPNSMDLFVSSGDGNITARSNPAPGGYTGAVTGGGKKYTITQAPSPLGGAGGLPLAGGMTAPGVAASGEVLAADLYFAYTHHKRQLPDVLGPLAA